MDEDASSEGDDGVYGAGGGAYGGYGDGGGGGEAGGEEEAVDEGGVLQLMEVLELPRGAAIELLARHGGDVTAAVLSVMS
ncbi:hypothetical protein GPECTOR_513g486 [Gonium pectorale]|uniref:Nascent polypeptide-associated complex subunit alpha-like UBA domain-containing protein n=1 Tax=Gonium pectorale TaxID=33097 RepID=A0A150FUV3_GONPE|nr:hypothetical protein GPECTOR_513g486 [Gonium pectorale]|eukprot:KXZ41377.1 hypothetical protein GPECTOR_513g486 [Gonium pectorale]